MSTIVLETFLAFGLCMAAVLIFAISDNYHELLQQRRQLQQPQQPAKSGAKPIGAGVRFGALLQQLHLGKSCWIHNLHGY